MAQNIQFARRQVGVNNVLGLHLRVAGRFVKLANAFQSEVRVCCKDIIADGRSILSLLSLAAECGTMLALEAEGCDAEDAVAALADLISAPSQDCEDQNGEAQNGSPESRPTQDPLKDGAATVAPESQKCDHPSKCGPRWDSWRMGSTTGPALDRRTPIRGRWNRGGGHGGG
jgi:phosphocarrier protein HPr